MQEPRSVRIVHPDGSEAERHMLDSALSQHGIAPDDVHVFYGGPTSADEWVSRVGDAEIVIAGWGVPDDAIVRFPNVRAIVFLGTGAADHINLPLAKERGIEVLPVLSYGDDSVAEHALALLLATARSIPELHADMREGNWAPRPGTLMRGKTLGVIGLGGIGRRMAEIAQGIGMNVIAWKRRAEQGETRDESGIPLAPLAAIFERADAISLHLALTPETEGLVSADLLDRLRSGAILVNTARAGVLDTSAALERASAGTLRYASDVFDQEPLPAEAGERSTPNTVLTPHVAFDTPEATQALYNGAAERVATLMIGTGQ